MSLCLFNLYAEYNIKNAGLDEAQAGIKIAGRNSNNLRYTDDTNFMAESEEELKSLFSFFLPNIYSAALGLHCTMRDLVSDQGSTLAPYHGSSKF